MKLKRSIASYEGCTAYAVSSGSPAQMAHFVTDAKADIATLAGVNFDLLSTLKAILRHGELANIDAGDAFTNYGGKKRPSKDVFYFPRHHLTEIETAIANAEGKS